MIAMGLNYGLASAVMRCDFTVTYNDFICRRAGGVFCGPCVDSSEYTSFEDDDSSEYTSLEDDPYPSSSSSSFSGAAIAGIFSLMIFICCVLSVCAYMLCFGAAAGACFCCVWCCKEKKSDEELADENAEDPTNTTV